MCSKSVIQLFVLSAVKKDFNSLTGFSSMLFIMLNYINKKYAALNLIKRNDLQHYMLYALYFIFLTLYVIFFLMWAVRQTIFLFEFICSMNHNLRKSVSDITILQKFFLLRNKLWHSISYLIFLNHFRVQFHVHVTLPLKLKTNSYVFDKYVNSLKKIYHMQPTRV